MKRKDDNTITYALLGIATVVAIVVGSIAFFNNVKEEDKYANLGNNLPSRTQNTQSASSQMGKTVNEVANETATNTNSISNTISQNITNTTKTTSKVTATATATPKKTSVETTADDEKEIEFMKPIEGELVKSFAKDNLIYSETLEEWTTHLGIDIKADENAEVVAVEAGTVKTIKNDPRNGFTITIEHENGYQSVYSNLQDSELVVEGEKVEKGQVIATIGKTAVSESKEESHLHFELLKDYEPVNPNEHLKY